MNLVWYDYGARFYDPQIGRFHTVDPATEKYYSLSPFTFCGNNPVNIVDPNGADWVIKSEEKDGKTIYTITINAKVYNNSGQDLDMDKLKSNITNQVQSIFSSNNVDGNIEVNTTMNLDVVTSLDDVKDTDHLISIESNSNYDNYAKENGAKYPQKTNGYADIGGLKIVIPLRTTEGIIQGTNTRTISHELGHTGGLYHPGSFNTLVTQGVNTINK